MIRFWRRLFLPPYQRVLDAIEEELARIAAEQGPNAAVRAAAIALLAIREVVRDE